jgi:hypothetical protein
LYFVFFIHVAQQRPDQCCCPLCLWLLQCGVVRFAASKEDLLQPLHPFADMDLVYGIWGTAQGGQVANE